MAQRNTLFCPSLLTKAEDRKKTSTRAMCTTYNELATCGRKGHVVNRQAKFDKCEKKAKGRDCQTLKHATYVGSVTCKAGKKCKL